MRRPLGNAKIPEFCDSTFGIRVLGGIVPRSFSFDDNGQPIDVSLNNTRRMSRAIHELLGFLRGIVADDYVNELEIEKLAKWLIANREITNEWPVSRLVKRIEQIYADGVADEEERADLADLIKQIIGSQDDETFLLTPTDLPLTKPEPDVIFDSNEFVLTGKFLFGTRKACIKEIEIRGGKCSDNVRLQTSYLVIGSFVSREWKYASYGNKIKKAAEYSERCPLAIISEKHWESFLLDMKAAGANG